MKKTLLLACLLALALVVGCTMSVPSTEQNTEPETNADTAFRAHYDALVTAMRGEIDDVREDLYITREDLLSRIEELEEALGALDNLPTVDTDCAENESLPSSTEPDGICRDPGSPLLYTVKDGTATVVGCMPAAGPSLAVPSTLGGYPVICIGDSALEGADPQCVLLPDTLTEIGWFAFAGCTELQVISIPASVKRIDYGAFDACPHLTLLCPKGSYAAEYAVSFGIPHILN